MKEGSGLLVVNEENGVILPSGSIQEQVPGKMSSGQRRTIRNLIVFSIGYFLIYTGFWALSNLQSTMNGEGGLGDDSQAAIYVCSMISSLLLPKWAIERFGNKKLLVFGTFICWLYIASNMWLKWQILMPASVLFGLMNGPYISAQTVYIDEMATRFQSEVEGQKNFEFVIATFFGMFLFFGENTQVWGNLISYYALSSPNQNVTSPKDIAECGLRFEASSNDTNSNLDPPTAKERYTLVGSYLAMGLLAVLLYAFCLDELKNDVKPGGNNCRSITDRVFAAIQHLRKLHQVLLIPLSVLIGMEGPFYTNEVTQAYIACSWGVHHVGFVTVCFGVCGAITALLVGPLVKYFSQMAVILLAACANLSTCIFLFFWQPTPEAPYTYFIVAGVWGMGDAIWWSQVTALYGLMFPEDREAAFSNLYFWSFLGFFLSYSYANYFSVAVKMYILLTFLTTGILGYLIGQIRIRCSARTQYVAIDQNEQ